jgi:hypothetical protein
MQVGLFGERNNIYTQDSKVAEWTTIDNLTYSPLTWYKVLPPFLFICRWIVQFYTIQRQIKSNGGSIIVYTEGLVPARPPPWLRPLPI